MSKKFRSVQTQHASALETENNGKKSGKTPLLKKASKALNRDYVTRPEFRGIVQEEYKQVLQDHAKRLAMVETQVQEEKQARVKLHKDVIELAAHIEEELNITQPQVAAAHKWLQSLDERCQGQHDKVLQALKAQEEDLNLREDKLHQEAKVISKSLDGEILERKASKNSELAWILVGAVGALGTSLEEALANVTSQVTGKFGNSFTLIEALVCKNHFCEQKATDTMKMLSDASYMRAVYSHGIQTSPNVEAQVNLTSLEMKLFHHDEPFIEDPWPPVSQLTFEAAFARIRSQMDVGVQQVTFRRPLHPCVSEDLFQFELIPDIGEPKILSVGTSSGKLCVGFITEKVDRAMCPEPNCYSELIVLGVEVRKQKEFLNGDAFQRHIEDTCNKALESYVRKEVMLLEVQRSSEEMCTPLRKLIEQLKKLKQLAEDCKAKDGYIHQCLENAETRLQNKDENLSDRINAVMDELPEKATVVAVDDVRGRLLYHVDLLEGFHMRLQKETTHKVEEVVTRLSEFQVILQDHEHALQHAAEEILHRGTKYDIAVLTDRVDKCALKDKMEGDLKEVREQLSWQSTKIESMQFQNGLSLQRSSTRRLGHSGMKSRNLSRSSSIASDAMGMGKTLSMKLTMTQASDMSVKFDDADSKAEDGSSSPSKKAQLDRQGSGHAMSLLLETDDAKDEAEEVQADPLDLLTGGDHLIEQQEQLQMLQEQLAEIQQASFMSGSTLTEVVQQQLEFLAQGVYCLGREQCTNLLSHLHAVMHWIIHRQRPAEWDPSALTTIALANASGEESAHSPPTVTRQDSQLEKGRSSLRRAKAASASQPKPTPERSNSPDDFFTRRQFAMGGPGWQQRSIPANGTYDDKRPKTSGAVLGSLHVSGGNAADGKRILVATPGVADVANSEQVKAEDAVSLPPLTGEPLNAAMAKYHRVFLVILLLQVLHHDLQLDFSKRVRMPRRPKSNPRARNRGASLLTVDEAPERRSWRQKTPGKSLRVPADDTGCCEFRVKRHWRWQQMIEQPLGVYEFCNSTGASRYHAVFATAPGEEEFLGCFKTPIDAAAAWDRRAREEGWPVLNYPRDGEEEPQTLLQDTFTLYRSKGFPYPPTDAAWRQQQLQELLTLNISEVWRSDLLIHIEDFQRCPGDELCWSFHPHSFDVSKMGGVNKRTGAPIKKPSALDTFISNSGLMKSLRTCLERCGDPTCSAETLRGECKFHDDSMIFQGGGSWIANFPATVAAAIYQRFAPNGVVYDACAGWGGRLLGARLGGVRKYIACEPSSKTFAGLQELKDLLSPELEVDLHQCGSEDFDVEEEVDVAFTSPPYFNTEWYSNERSQSHVRFPTVEVWREGFLRPMLLKMVTALRPGGHLILSVTTRRSHRRSGLDLEGDVHRIVEELGLVQEPTLTMLKTGTDNGRPLFERSERNLTDVNVRNVNKAECFMSHARQQAARPF
eukprot:symbB.v1.2.013825.t1/scaffold990.1/size146246/7